MLKWSNWVSVLIKLNKLFTLMVDLDRVCSVTQFASVMLVSNCKNAKMVTLGERINKVE